MRYSTALPEMLCPSRALLALSLGMLTVAGGLVDAQDRQPADLVDMEYIQSMTLEELRWREEHRQETAGVLEIRGSWEGPVYRGYAPGSIEVERQLTESARIWIPVAQTAGARVSQLVLGNHTLNVLNEPRTACQELAERLPLAVVRHAEKEEDWTSIGFRDRDHWIGFQNGAMRAQNPCAPEDFRSSNYQYCLAETQMMALTLLSRLLEASGYVPGPAGMMGISKEGSSTWIASAIDDRLVAAAPGGCFSNVLDMVQAWVDNGHCGLADDLLWLRTTAAADAFLDYWSVDRFAADLKPEFLLLWGDVGLSGMHDGTYFEILHDTRFLETFSTAPFRYDRLPDHNVRESREQYRSRLMKLLAHYLLTREIDSYPKVDASSVEVEDGRFRAVARVSPDPQSVRLWWSHSDNRRFNDSGNAPFVPVDMLPDGDLWVSPWVDAPDGEMIGWHVEAESLLAWEGLSLPRRDTSPQRFFHVFEPFACSQPPLPNCPLASPTGCTAVGGHLRVELDWDDGTDFGLAGYDIYRSERSTGRFERLNADGLLEDSHYIDTEIENTTTYDYRILAVDAWGRRSSPCRTEGRSEIFIRADSNGDGRVDLSDAVATLGALLLGQGATACGDAADANDDGAVDISDAIATLGVLFLGNGMIPLPGMNECGVDPTDDELGCETFERCP